MEMSEGYNTKIGERGASISGGQKQRIAIARTILSRPKLLILDEATSALDYETEFNVFKNINIEFKDSTIFCVTHRIPAVIDADQIIFLKNGSIVEKERIKNYFLCREIISRFIKNKKKIHENFLEGKINFIWRKIISSYKK